MIMELIVLAVSAAGMFACGYMHRCSRDSGQRYPAPPRHRPRLLQLLDQVSPHQSCRPPLNSTDATGADLSRGAMR